MKSIRWIRLLSEILLLMTVSVSSAESFGQSPSAFESRFGVGLEFGSLWFSKNDVRVPGNIGTPFDMTDLTGSGPDFFTRLEGYWNINGKHGLRLLVAPLEVSGTGELQRDTVFAGETFPGGTTQGTYNFSTYRLTYRYTFADRGDWRWRLGFTGIVRDADIELIRGTLRANDDDLGFVPALHLSGDYRFASRWMFRVDLDGLAGGPGRLFDIALKLNYDLNDNWRIGGGYRTLEGGVENDEVYNFAWLHSAVFDLHYRF